MLEVNKRELVTNYRKILKSKHGKDLNYTTASSRIDQFMDLIDFLAYLDDGVLLNHGNKRQYSLQRRLSADTSKKDNLNNFKASDVGLWGTQRKRLGYFLKGQNDAMAGIIYSLINKKKPVTGYINHYPAYEAAPKFKKKHLDQFMEFRKLILADEIPERYLHLYDSKRNTIINNIQFKSKEAAGCLYENNSWKFSYTNPGVIFPENSNFGRDYLELYKKDNYFNPDIALRADDGSLTHRMQGAVYLNEPIGLVDKHVYEVKGVPFCNFYLRDAELKNHSLAIDLILQDFPILTEVFNPLIPATSLVPSDLNEPTRHRDYSDQREQYDI